MLSRQFARGVQLRVTTRYFTHSSIVREINKDKLPVQKSSETVKDTDEVIGKKRVYIK